MNCLVCGKPHIKDEDCVICGFPIVNVPAPYEEGVKLIAPTIKAYREGFSKKLTVGLEIYHWKLSNTKIDLERTEKIPFGKYNELLGQTKWLGTVFDSVSKRTDVDVCVYAEIDNSPNAPITTQTNVKIVNPTDGETCKLGITVNEDYTFTLNVKTDSGAETVSEKTALFQ